MPVYVFEHPRTKRVKEIVQGINDEHVYTERGVKWNRVFTVPNAIIDGNPDPFSVNSFDDKTKNDKGGQMKHLWERSAELSEKRASKRDGVDPVKQKFYEEYAKSHRGNPHPSVNADKEYTVGF